MNKETFTERRKEQIKQLLTEEQKEQFMECCRIIDGKSPLTIPFLQTAIPQFESLLEDFQKERVGRHHITRDELFSYMGIVDESSDMYQHGEVIDEMGTNDISVYVTNLTPHDELWIVKMHDVDLMDKFSISGLHVVTLSKEKEKFVNGVIFLDENLEGDPIKFRTTMRHEICHQLLAIEYNVYEIGHLPILKELPRAEEFICWALPFLIKRVNLQDSIEALEDAKDYMEGHFAKEVVKFYQQYFDLMTAYYENEILEYCKA